MLAGRALLQAGLRPQRMHAPNRVAWIAVLAALAAPCAASPAQEPESSSYIASRPDFVALQDGIRAARRLRARLFPNGIDETDIALYDSKDVYLYSRDKDLPLAKKGSWSGYVVYQASHGAKVSEREMARCGATPDFVFAALGSAAVSPFFSCSPWNIQAALQRKKRASIYDTRDSYLGTVIHEFAHAYHRQEVDRIPVLPRIDAKVRLLESRHPSRRIVEEAYAIWCELRASQELFPAHFRRLYVFHHPGMDDPHNLGAKVAMEILNEDAVAPQKP